MKELVLFANVNPLEPNKLIKVWSSSYCGSTNEATWWHDAFEYRETLQSKGYKVEIHEKVTKIIK